MSLINRELKKMALAKEISPYAHWSYASIDLSDISDENLIEAVLLHGKDPLKRRLFDIYKKDIVKRIWRERLIIQGGRLNNVNQHIASELFQLKNPSDYIQRAYKKHNLYERFSS